MNVVRGSCQLFVLLFATQSMAAEAPLVWKFKTGQEHHFQMTQLMDMQMSLGAADRKIETGVQQVIDMTWRVDEVDNAGSAKISQTVDRLRMEMQAPGQPDMKYDTDSNEAPAGFAAMLAPLFEVMTESTFTMTMSPRGAIDNVVVPEALTKAMKAIPGAAMMGEMFSDEGFKSMVQKGSLVLPKPADLKIGHEWTTKSEMKNAQFGSISSEFTYRYLGTREVEGTEYEVFGVKLKMDFGEGVNGIAIDIVAQDSSGEILFDRQVGHLESSKLQQEIDMQVLVGTQTMSQKMTQKVFFERAEKP